MTTQESIHQAALSVGAKIIQQTLSRFYEIKSTKSSAPKAKRQVANDFLNSRLYPIIRVNKRLDLSKRFY